MQDLGLQSAYRHYRGTYSFVRKMMALPFLPKREIPPMFEALHNEASGTLLEFADYVSSTWISGTTCRPTDWTCYKQAIRTNNDIEGWHHGLNRRASGRTQLPLYLLQAGHPNKQRHRGLAPWPKSPSVWTNTTSAVPSDPASSQGSEADSNSEPPGVRKEAAKNSATKVQRAPAQNLRAVGPVRGRGEISKTTTEGLLLS